MPPILTADAPMTAQEQKLVAGERLQCASLRVKFLLPESCFSSVPSVRDDPPSSKTSLSAFLSVRLSAGASNRLLHSSHCNLLMYQSRYHRARFVG